MKHNVRPAAFLLSFIIVTTVLFSAACVPAGLIALTGTPEPNLAAMAALDATPTATPCPTPSTTPQFSEERKAELNQRIQDFLNKEGDYTPKEISSITFAMSSLPDEKNLQLGLADGASKIGCVFFDYFEKNDNLILLMGFDGKDGDRFITPVQIPLYYLKNEQKYHFWFFKHHEDTFYDEGVESSPELCVNSLLYNQATDLWVAGLSTCGC